MIRLAAIIVVLPTLAFAVPSNELPLYGGKAKSATEKEADSQFIAQVTRISGTRAKAAATLEQRGWSAVASGNTATAIKRFNQAWLLTPNDAQTYWGLAVTSSMQSKNQEAYKLFERAIDLEPKNARILCDYGHAKTQEALQLLKDATSTASKQAIANFAKADGLYKQALAIDPKSALPHSRLAVLYFYRGNDVAAKLELDVSKKLGGEGLDARFVEMLEKK